MIEKPFINRLSNDVQLRKERTSFCVLGIGKLFIAEIFSGLGLILIRPTICPSTCVFLRKKRH